MQNPLNCADALGVQALLRIDCTEVHERLTDLFFLLWQHSVTSINNRTPVTKHHSASIQRKQRAAAQGSSLSPLTKKGSISLYSRIFTMGSFGALPCTIARNACSDCATIARARSFLWIE